MLQHTVVAKPPILLDSGADLESIKKASEQSYTLAKKTVEDFFISSIDMILGEEIPSDTADECDGGSIVWFFPPLIVRKALEGQ